MVELYNPNNQQVSLEGIFLWYYGGSTPVLKQVIDLSSVTIDAKSFALFGKLKSGHCTGHWVIVPGR